MPREITLPADSIPTDEVSRDYVEHVRMLVASMRVLTVIPLSQMADVNERMQTMAPFVARPFEYAKGASNLETQRKLIDAALKVQTIIRELQP